MNKGPTYFNQSPAGVPQPPNSPYQPGFTGYQAPQQNQQPTGYQPPVQQGQTQQQAYPGFQPAGQQGYAGYQQPAQPQQPQGYTGYQQPAQPQRPQSYTAYQQPVQGQRPQGYTGYQQPMQGQQPYAGPYQQPPQGQTPYAGYQQPWPGQQPMYPRPGYPYQANGVPQQGVPLYNSQIMRPVQPVPPPQPQQPAQPVDLDGIARLVVYLALPVLLVLFIVGMAVSGLAWLKWVFVGLAAVVALMVWVRPLLRDDIRITVTCILGVMAVVAAVSAVNRTPADTKNPGTTQQQTGAQMQATAEPVVNPFDNYGMIVNDTPLPATPTPAPASSGMQSEAVERMESFLYFWSVNNMDSMYTLCAPSWIKEQKGEPMKALYSVLANRTPTSYEAKAISGTDNDLTRTITVNIDLHRNNGNAPKTYQFKILMKRENEMWYIDPASLESNEAATATPASAVITQMPTPAPVADPNTLLYYNPDGGSYYHLDNYCKSANARNLPFKGTFTYGQLNDSAYANLISCPVCAAPKRPAKN